MLNRTDKTTVNANPHNTPNVTTTFIECDNPISQHPELWATINGVPGGLVEQMIAHARKRNWTGFFRCVSAPFRFTILDAVKNHLTDSEFWRAFRFIWTCCENSWEDMPLIESLLDLKKPDHQDMMTEEEQMTLSKLPDKLRVYRAATVYNIFGFSWTLSKSKAEWFAVNRQPHPLRFCLYGFCEKKYVLGLFLERKEKEIFILPDNVKITNGTVVRSRRSHGSYIHTKQYWLREQELIQNLYKSGECTQVMAA